MLNEFCDDIDYNAQLISFRILAEVERICDLKGMNKTELAAGIGTSKSYITQLFRGHKQINMGVMAKFQKFLNITFSIISTDVIRERTPKADAGN